MDSHVLLALTYIGVVVLFFIGVAFFLQFLVRK